MTLERFRLAAVLPPEGGWRLELALDVSVAPPKPVVLARVPPAVSGDALALTTLMREVERAVRVVHPALLPVRGLADAGGLAVLCDWREGESLRALLDAGGPLAPPLAALVLLGAAEALQAAHAAGAVHGDVRPERVLVTEDGAALLTGLGRSAGPAATAEEDLAGLAALATACLGPDQGADEAAAVAVASAHPTVREVAAALRRLAVASAADLAARLEAVLPADGAERSARRLALTLARRPAPGGETSVERPALSPPPLPSGLRTVPPRPPAPPARPPAPRPAAPPAPSLAAAPAVPTGAAPPPPPDAATPGLGRLADPRLPLVVGLAAAILGLVVGYWLGA